MERNLTLLVFTLTYLGLSWGNVPGLRLDRAAISLIGAVVLLGFHGVSGPGPGPAAKAAIDVPTLK